MSAHHVMHQPIVANNVTATCDPWPPYPTHYYNPWPYAPGWSPPAPSTYTIQTLPNTEPAPLSDADVERIARRVAELLKATP